MLPNECRSVPGHGFHEQGHAGLRPLTNNRTPHPHTPAHGPRLCPTWAVRHFAPGCDQTAIYNNTERSRTGNNLRTPCRNTCALRRLDASATVTCVSVDREKIRETRSAIEMLTVNYAVGQKQELSYRKVKASCLYSIIHYMQHCHGTVRFII